MAHPRTSTYVKFPSPPPLGPRDTQIILISSIYGMQRYENFATTLWKKCWKGAPFWNGNFNWNTRVKGHPAGCPLSPGASGFAHPEPIGVTPLGNLYSFSYVPFIMRCLYVCMVIVVRHRAVNFTRAVDKWFAMDSSVFIMFSNLLHNI